MKYSSVIVSGTFDRLHTGHQRLIKTAFSVGRQIVIGLTTDEYVKKFKSASPQTIDAFSVRKHALEVWLKDQRWVGRYTIFPLNDSYGPSLESGTPYEAIVVSSQTRSVAETINTFRMNKHLRPLSIIEIPMISAEDLQTVSSTRIRNGEIDTAGRLVLPDSLRPELKKIIGEIISEGCVRETFSSDTGKIIITVGDMTTEKFLRYGIKPSLAIIDLQMDRKPFLWESVLFRTLLDDATRNDIQSGPGYVSGEAIRAIRKWADRTALSSHTGTHAVFLIDGEEDLLVLPVLYYGPIGAVIYYGQPKKGIVRVLVTGDKKRYAYDLMKRFTTDP